MQKEHPLHSRLEICKLLGDKWKGRSIVGCLYRLSLIDFQVMTEEEKLVYVEHSEKDTIRYKAELVEYYKQVNKLLMQLLEYKIIYTEST